jgi:hypothetical protein
MSHDVRVMSSSVARSNCAFICATLLRRHSSSRSAAASLRSSSWPYSALRPRLVSRSGLIISSSSNWASNHSVMRWLSAAISSAMGVLPAGEQATTNASAAAPNIVLMFSLSIATLP